LDPFQYEEVTFGKLIPNGDGPVIHSKDLVCYKIQTLPTYESHATTLHW
jgi:hypothetical protein